MSVGGCACRRTRDDDFPGAVQRCDERRQPGPGLGGRKGTRQRAAKVPRTLVQRHRRPRPCLRPRSECVSLHFHLFFSRTPSSKTERPCTDSSPLSKYSAYTFDAFQTVGRKIGTRGAGGCQEKLHRGQAPACRTTCREARGLRAELNRAQARPRVPTDCACGVVVGRSQLTRCR